MKQPKRRKEPKQWKQWKRGETCNGAHPCPSPDYPNHHAALCICSLEELGVHDIDQCTLCHAIVCKGCKNTIL